MKNILAASFLLISALFAEAFAQDAGRVVTGCSTRAYTVGTNQPITLDPNGDLCVEATVVIIPSPSAGAAIVPVVSLSVETGRVLKASAGNLYSVSVTTGAVSGRVLVHNSTTVPAAGAVTPLDCAIVAANSTVMLSYDPPMRLGTGISVSFSTATTCFTQTDSATAFISGSVL